LLESQLKPQGASIWERPAYTPSYSAYYDARLAPGNYPASPSSGRYYGALANDGAATRTVHVNLAVPADARIWFNGTQTHQTGTVRSFESPPLDRGREYTYQIRIQWKQDGKDVTQARQVVVQAGDVINLTLGSPSGSSVAHASR
jgi:uncharacterized protein (TIGR03000 family)